MLLGIKTQILNLALSCRMETENKIMQFTAFNEFYTVAAVSSQLMSVMIYSPLLAAFTDRLSYFTNAEAISRDHVCNE